MGSNGWIKLYREITDHWIWDDPVKFQRWIDLLLMVNHENKKVIIDKNVVEIQAGQKFTSIRKLAARWHCSKNTVTGTLNLLQRDGMLYKQALHGGTLITIVNYRDYQGFSRNEKDTNKDTNKDTDGTRPGRKLTTNNNVKNDIRMKKNNIGDWQ